MVEVQKYVPAASALLSLQRDLESYLVLIIVSIIIKHWLSSFLYFAPGACVFRFLADHPEYLTDGVNLSRFSFQIPKPLQENYVRKRSHAKSAEPEQGT
jgi:hypothetical protein